MAQYWEDWSGSTVGQAPAGWTKRWSTSNATYTVVEDELGPAGRALKIDLAGAARRFLSFDAVGSVTDFKIRALIKGPGTTDQLTNFAGVAGRGGGSASNETAYLGLYKQTAAFSGTRCIAGHRYKNASGGALGTGYVYTVGDLYWVGLEVSGSTVRLTAAEAGTPGTLILDESISDANIEGSGWVGLFDFAAVSAPYYVYAVGVGTGEDEAPTSDPGGATHELAGAATASISASGDLTTQPAGAVKGVREQLGDGTTPAASLTGLSVRWWDNATATGAPDYEVDGETTDEGGWLEVDLDAVTALDMDDYGYLLVLKNGDTTDDDVVAAGRVKVKDISS